MDKKDIYEHLAKIYLDASSSKKKKSKSYLKVFKPLFLVGISGLCVASLIILVNSQKHKSQDSQIALLISTDAAKINFNFNPAKKEVYSLNLNKLKMNRFNTLGFSAKSKNYQDNISMRVEFTNSFREKSEIYVTGIPNKWHEYKINLADFKKISDWSEMSNLSFTVEEWNTKFDSGVVYIDNIRFSKE